MTERIVVTAADLAKLNPLRAYAPLRHELARALVVSSALVSPDVATMNSRVRYVDGKDGARRAVSLVYPSQADAAKGKVSVLAPVGCALLGLSEGQSVEWDFPDGSRRRLKLEKVLFQPERLANSALPRAP
jgi:regulator of nucleoside diphosphate kinase